MAAVVAVVFSLALVLQLSLGNDGAQAKTSSISHTRKESIGTSVSKQTVTIPITAAEQMVTVKE